MSSDSDGPKDIYPSKNKNKYNDNQNPNTMITNKYANSIFSNKLFGSSEANNENNNYPYKKLQSNPIMDKSKNENNMKNNNQDYLINRNKSEEIRNIKEVQENSEKIKYLDELFSSDDEKNSSNSKKNNSKNIKSISSKENYNMKNKMVNDYKNSKQNLNQNFLNLDNNIDRQENPLNPQGHERGTSVKDRIKILNENEQRKKNKQYNKNNTKKSSKINPQKKDFPQDRRDNTNNNSNNNILRQSDCNSVELNQNKSNYNLNKEKFDTPRANIITEHCKGVKAILKLTEERISRIRQEKEDQERRLKILADNKAKWRERMKKIKKFINNNKEEKQNDEEFFKENQDFFREYGIDNCKDLDELIKLYEGGGMDDDEDSSNKKLDDEFKRETLKKNGQEEEEEEEEEEEAEGEEEEEDNETGEKAAHEELSENNMENIENLERMEKLNNENMEKINENMDNINENMDNINENMENINENIENINENIMKDNKSENENKVCNNNIENKNDDFNYEEYMRHLDNVGNGKREIVIEEEEGESESKSKFSGWENIPQQIQPKSSENNKDNEYEREGDGEGEEEREEEEEGDNNKENEEEEEEEESGQHVAHEEITPSIHVENDKTHEEQNNNCVVYISSMTNPKNRKPKNKEIIYNKDIKKPDNTITFSHRDSKDNLKNSTNSNNSNTNSSNTESNKYIKNNPTTKNNNSKKIQTVVNTFTSSNLNEIKPKAQTQKLTRKNNRNPKDSERKPQLDSSYSNNKSKRPLPKIENSKNNTSQFEIQHESNYDFSKAKNQTKPAKYKDLSEAETGGLNINKSQIVKKENQISQNTINYKFCPDKNEINKKKVSKYEISKRVNVGKVNAEKKEKKEKYEPKELGISKGQVNVSYVSAIERNTFSNYNNNQICLGERISGNINNNNPKNNIMNQTYTFNSSHFNNNNILVSSSANSLNKVSNPNFNNNFNKTYTNNNINLNNNNQFENSVSLSNVPYLKERKSNNNSDLELLLRSRSSKLENQSPINKNNESPAFRNFNENEKRDSKYQKNIIASLDQMTVMKYMIGDSNIPFDPSFLDVLCINCYECVKYKDMDKHSEHCVIRLDEFKDNTYDEDYNTRLYKLHESLKMKKNEIMRTKNSHLIEFYNNLLNSVYEILINNNSIEELDNSINKINLALKKETSLAEGKGGFGNNNNNKNVLSKNYRIYFLLFCQRISQLVYMKLRDMERLFPEDNDDDKDSLLDDIEYEDYINGNINNNKGGDNQNNSNNYIYNPNNTEDMDHIRFMKQQLSNIEVQTKKAANELNQWKKEAKMLENNLRRPQIQRAEQVSDINSDVHSKGESSDLLTTLTGQLSDFGDGFAAGGGAATGNSLGKIDMNKYSDEEKKKYFLSIGLDLKFKYSSQVQDQVSIVDLYDKAKEKNVKPNDYQNFLINELKIKLPQKNRK